MRRRDFVKGILAASAAARSIDAQQATVPAPPVIPPAAQHVLPPPTPIAPGPVPWMRGLMDVKPLEMSTLVPDAVAQTEAHFFTEPQRLALRRLSGIFMPPLNGRPGALDAGTPEFLDFLIGVSPADRRQMYQDGLDWLDAEAKRKFAVSFANATDAQADALIRPWLRTWMSDHPPTEPYARFINLVHGDIRMATINSQAWSEAGRAAGHGAAGVDLYWYPVDPNLHREDSGPPQPEGRA